MKTTNLVLLAALITVGGQWAQDKPLTPKIAVGAFFAAVGLSAISNADAALGHDLAMLILVGATLANGPALFTAAVPMGWRWSQFF